MASRCMACGGPLEYDSASRVLCDNCEEQGWWVDPAGGLHEPEEDDPAAMYESLNKRLKTVLNEDMNVAKMFQDMKIEMNKIASYFNNQGSNPVEAQQALKILINRAGYVLKSVEQKQNNV